MEDRLAGDLVGQANARSEVQVVTAQTAARNSVGSNLLQGRCRDGWNEGVFLGVNFTPWPAQEVLIVHAQIQREPIADFVVVLRVEG